jgi:hypothetical protein
VLIGIVFVASPPAAGAHVLSSPNQAPANSYDYDVAAYSYDAPLGLSSKRTAGDSDGSLTRRTPEAVAREGSAIVSDCRDAAKGVDDGVDLYRHVSPGELTDIGKNGFRPGPNSLGGTWFAESGEQASQWGRVLNGKPSIFAGELNMLREAGYTRTGDYMKPPA